MQKIRIKNEVVLNKIEKDLGVSNWNETIPYAQDMSYSQIIDNIQDRDGEWKNELYLYITEHPLSMGERLLAKRIHSFLGDAIDGKDAKPYDILSTRTKMTEHSIKMAVLIRCYTEEPDYRKFFQLIGQKNESIKPIKTVGKLLVPDHIKNFKYSEEELEEHQEKVNKQNELFEEAEARHIPILNMVNDYEPRELPKPSDSEPLIYDLASVDKQIKTRSSYEDYRKAFEMVMKYVSGIEFNSYKASLDPNTGNKKAFMDVVDSYIQTHLVMKKSFPKEDVPVLKRKIERALYKLYIIQDLIDDPKLTDIKITAPDSIRVRVDGKAYLSNISFIDLNDYLRFINMIIIKNNIDPNYPVQTFTDNHDENYILRFSLTSTYVNSTPWPYLHIRKVARKKLMEKELLGKMFDEKVMKYLLDCGKHSRGVVFAGPPGCGKTVILNWFLEKAYEDSAEILVIQENDELFAYRKGVMFEHVVNNPIGDQQFVSLEKLGQLALVAGANVFIIGEAKGAEICSAITLSNSGCRTALTIHSPSSTETVDKMADLAMRGFANSYSDAKRMLQSFQTIVYLQDFKVQEIAEITGYDEKRKDVSYRMIYKREDDRKKQKKEKHAKIKQPKIAKNQFEELEN